MVLTWASSLLKLWLVIQKLLRRSKKETSGHRRGRCLRADARVFQRLITVSRLVVVHHNSASSLDLFLRADLLEQQGRKAPPVLLQQAALSAVEEPGPEEDRVGPLFAEVKNSAQSSDSPALQRSLRPAGAKTICGRAAPQVYCPWCVGQYADNGYHADTIVVGMAFHYDGDASAK